MQDPPTHPQANWGALFVGAVYMPPTLFFRLAGIAIQRLKDRIGSVKAPKRVEFWDDMPRSPVGKLLKNEIRKTFWGNAERAVN